MNNIYVPPFSTILEGLGIAEIRTDSVKIEVFVPFLLTLLQTLVRQARFDPDFYETTYPDAVQDCTDGGFLSLHDHFVRKGYFQGLAPAAPRLDLTFYRNYYRDLHDADDAFLEQHFFEHGIKEGRFGTSEEIDAANFEQALVFSRQRGTAASLAYASIPEAKVQVFDDLFLGGPILEDTPVERRLRHIRDGVAADGFKPDQPFDHRLPGCWVYIGPYYSHFGHVMAELVHRILPARRIFGDQKLLIVAPMKGGRPQVDASVLPHVYRDVLTFLDVDLSRVTVIQQNHVVETLQIVEQGSQLGVQANAGYLHCLTEFSSRRLALVREVVKRHERVYVSRSRLVPVGGLLGECYLEAQLQNEGFHIFHPQDFPFAAQMAQYVKADIILFLEGSSCHGTELLGFEAMNSTVLLSRRTGHAENFRKILEPRSRKFTAFYDIEDFGTIVAHPATAEPMFHQGIAAYDTLKFSSFLLGTLGIKVIFSETDYRNAAREDFRKYVAYHRSSSRLLAPQTVFEVTERARKYLDH